MENSTNSFADEINPNNMDFKYHSIWYDIKNLSKTWLKNENERDPILIWIQNKKLFEFKVFSISFFLYHLKKEQEIKFTSFVSVCVDQLKEEIADSQIRASESQVSFLSGSFIADDRYILEKIEYYIEDIENYSTKLAFPSFTFISILKSPLSQSSEIFNKISGISVDTQFADEYGSILERFLERYKNKSQHDISKNSEIINLLGDGKDNLSIDLLEFIKKGEELINKKEYHSAIEVLDKVIKNNIQLENAFFYRGYAKRELNQFFESIIDFNIALIINSNHIAALYQCVYSLNSLSRFYESHVLVNKLIELSPDGDTYELRGNIKKKLGDFDGAQKDFEKAMEYPRDCF